MFTFGEPSPSPASTPSAFDVKIDNTTMENTSTDATPTMQGSTDTTTKQSATSCTSRVLTHKKYVVVVVLGIIAGAVAAVYTQNTSNSGLLDWIPFLEFLDNNPHGGNTPYDFSLWRTPLRSCRGLELYIVDNLDDRWKPFLQQAVDDWDNGSPDALTLHLRQITTRDPDCTPVQNVLKVCNGDYGKTDWVGVNIAVIKHDFITSSVGEQSCCGIQRSYLKVKV
eukprot:scaffold4733_cov170-Alexandrium_tamarense.AAC.8